MGAYEATLATAKLFEQRPELFDYSQTLIPDCGAPGCALGYIGHFMGHTGEIDGEQTVRVGSGDFYNQMRSLAPNWIFSSVICAKGLRLYAEKYLRSDHIPAEVRSIFEQEPAHWEGVDIMLSSERITRGITHPSIDSVILDVNEDARLYDSP